MVSRKCLKKQYSFHTLSSVYRVSPSSWESLLLQKSFDLKIDCVVPSKFVVIDYFVKPLSVDPRKWSNFEIKTFSNYIFLIFLFGGFFHGCNLKFPLLSKFILLQKGLILQLSLRYLYLRNIYIQEKTPMHSLQNIGFHFNSHVICQRRFQS